MTEKNYGRLERAMEIMILVVMASVAATFLLGVYVLAEIAFR